MFGVGWAFCPCDEIVRIDLENTTVDGQKNRLSLAYGNHRPDIQAYYRDCPSASHSGFYIYGALQSETEMTTQMSLIFYLASGEKVQRTLQPNKVGVKDISLRMRRLQLWRDLTIGAWLLIKQGKLSATWHKAKWYMGKKLRDENDPIEKLLSLLRRSGCNNWLLVVDHDLGGGANEFRKEIVEDALATGRSIILLTYHVQTFRYAVEVITTERREKFSVDCLDIFLPVVQSGFISKLIYNNAVSYESPLQIPTLLKMLSRVDGVSLTVYVHDYLAICPSQFLLNSEGVFCGIPDIEICQSCLRHHTDGFVSLHTSRDIRAWRTAWGECLVDADRIICFSESSRRYLLKVYPSLDVMRIIILPHVVDLDLSCPAVIAHQSSLHIGIVGKISYHKGATVVRDLAWEISRRGGDVRITIIGSLSTSVPKGVVKETGAYAPKDLKRLIENSGANVFLFPSICPETFSYVTAELIQLGVPLVCFNWGAPAERVAQYRNGRVVDYRDNKQLLDDLINFHLEIAAATVHGKENTFARDV